MQSSNPDLHTGFSTAAARHELKRYLADKALGADFFVSPSPEGWWRPIDRLAFYQDFVEVNNHLHQQGSWIPMPHWLSPNYGVVPAHHAAECGYLSDLLKEWHKHEEKLPESAWQTKDDQQRTLLHAMTRNNLFSYLENVENAKGALPDASAWHVADDKGNTPFALMADNYYLKSVVDWMVAHQQPLPDRSRLTQPNKKEETPLQTMLEKGHYETAIHLLEATGDHLQLEDVTTGPAPGTPYPILHTAIWGEKLPLIAEAVARGGEKITMSHLTEPAPNGSTLLHWMAIQGTWNQLPPVLRLSGERLAESHLNIADPYGNTPLKSTVNGLRLNNLVAATAEIGEPGLAEKLVELDNGSQYAPGLRFACCSGASEAIAKAPRSRSVEVLAAVRSKLSSAGSSIVGGGTSISGPVRA